MIVKSLLNWVWIELNQVMFHFLHVDGTENHLKEHLIDDLDYVLVPQEAWEKLIEWYGSVDSQEPVARKVVEYGMFVKHCKVEVYLMELKLCENGKNDTYVTQQFSKADTIGTLIWSLSGVLRPFACGLDFV